MKGDDEKIVLYDGVCNLCDATVRFILPRDPDGRLRFASLQGPYGRAALARHGVGAVDEPASIVYVENGRPYFRSDAVLGIARSLAFPWNLAALFLVVPRPLRDAVYRWVARNRYRWFGKNETCLLPAPEWKGRFLD